MRSLDPLAEDLRDYVALYKRAFFDELISKINLTIEALPVAERAQPDPRLLYLRGLARYKLGWFELAKPDLLAAQQAKVTGLQEGLGPDWVLSYIKKRDGFLPPKVQEIRDGDRVLFRMHYYGMEDGTATVMAMLPEAYRISQQMFGADVEATTVYVFDNYEQFVAYYKAFEETQGPGSWYAAITIGDLVFISLRDTNGELRARDGRDFFKTTIVHEYNHAMFHRLMGFSPQPSWFVEGLAQNAGAQVDPNYDAVKQRILKRLFQNHALLPLDTLGDNDAFAAQVELGLRMEKGNDGQFAPDPYAQGYGMTQYLLNNISTAQLQSFLNRVRESKNFDGSFATEFGFSVEQFYEMWKRDTSQKFAAQ